MEGRKKIKIQICTKAFKNVRPFFPLPLKATAHGNWTSEGHFLQWMEGVAAQ